jgi:cephalosporin hydroxylase
MGVVRIDFDKGVVAVEEPGGEVVHDIGSPEAFRLISRAWLRSGWDAKYVYSFSWLGRPVIQLPDDLLRIQEVIYRLRPDFIVETGVAHGGSLVFYASLCKVMGHGRVIGIDIEVRPHNRRALEEHALFEYITLIEGSSIARDTVDRVRSLVGSGTVIVLLDSCHAKEHVAAELEAYSPLVSKDSYIVAMDGIMEQVAGAPRTEPDWTWNNPRRAALEFADTHTEFVLEDPPFSFNESHLTERVTYWPNAFLKRVR